MKFRPYVEPAERMKELEVPPQVVEALGGGKRPRVLVKIVSLACIVVAADMCG